MRRYFLAFASAVIFAFHAPALHAGIWIDLESSSTRFSADNDLPSSWKVIDFSEFNDNPLFTLGPVPLGHSAGEDITVTAGDLAFPLIGSVSTHLFSPSGIIDGPQPPKSPGLPGTQPFFNTIPWSNFVLPPGATFPNTPNPNVENDPNRPIVPVDFPTYQLPLPIVPTNPVPPYPGGGLLPLPPPSSGHSTISPTPFPIVPVPPGFLSEIPVAPVVPGSWPILPPQYPMDPLSGNVDAPVLPPSPPGNPGGVNIAIPTVPVLPPYVPQHNFFLGNIPFDLGSNGRWDTGRNGYIIGDHMYFAFDNPVHGLGFRINHVSPGNVELSLWDAENHVLAGIQFWISSNDPSLVNDEISFIAIAPTRGISGFRVEGVGPIVIDDLVFQPTAAPEPATMLTFLAGFYPLYRARLKRSKARP